MSKNLTQDSLDTKDKVLDYKEQLKEGWKESKFLFESQILGLALEPFQADIINWRGTTFGNTRIEGVLAPRGSGKSEVGTVGDALHEFVHDPNMATQIVAESEGTSKTFLGAIKQHLEQNDLLRKVYGNHVPQRNRGSLSWSTTCITSAQRTCIRKEPTIQCLGAAGRIVGRHVSIQWCDDLVSLSNSATDDARSKLWHWYNTALCPILDPGGSQRIRGTRYFQKDLYYKMMKEYGMEAFLIIPAITRKPEQPPDEYAFPIGNVEERTHFGVNKFRSSGHACVYPQSEEHSYWPSRFPLAVLQAKRKMDYISFNTQFQNNTNVLKSELINDGALIVVKESEIPPIEELIFYIGVDPARKTSGDGCLFSICTVAVHSETGMIYIIRQQDRKLADPEVMCQFIASEFHYIRNLGGVVRAIGVEENAFQGVLRTSLQNHPDKYGYLPFVEKNTKHDKVMRFINCSAYFNSMIVRWHPSCMQLLEDTAEFPDCDYKDRVDSMMHAFELIELTGITGVGLNLDIMSWTTDMSGGLALGFD